MTITTLEELDKLESDCWYIANYIGNDIISDLTRTITNGMSHFSGLTWNQSQAARQLLEKFAIKQIVFYKYSREMYIIKESRISLVGIYDLKLFNIIKIDDGTIPNKQSSLYNLDIKKLEEKLGINLKEEFTKIKNT